MVALSSDSEPPFRGGFTLVESLVAVTIATISGAAILVAISSSVRATDDARQIGLAQGLAAQLMDEISAVRFPSAVSSIDSSTSGRIGFDDIDDYAGYVESPPTSRDGTRIGSSGYEIDGVRQKRLDAMLADLSRLARFERSVIVERVEPDSSAGWTVKTTHTNYRRVTVQVSYTDSNKTKYVVEEMTRIFSHVPIAP